LSTFVHPPFNAHLGSDLEQAGGGNGEGGTQPHKGVKGGRKMAIFYAVNGLAVDSCQFGKAGLAEIVFGTQGEQAVGKLGTHVLYIALEHRLARLGNSLCRGFC